MTILNDYLVISYQNVFVKFNIYVLLTPQIQSNKSYTIIRNLHFNGKKLICY